jgi:hypothetical protein
MKCLVKFAVLTFAACLATVATAADSNPPGYYDKASMCTSFANIFQTIAAERDIGESPQKTYKIIMEVGTPRSGGRFGISEQQVKTAVNLIYFDPSFAHERIGSQADPMTNNLSSAIFEACANDWKSKPAFQPLR